jgi:hypothetical protein
MKHKNLPITLATLVIHSNSFHDDQTVYMWIHWGLATVASFMKNRDISVYGSTAQHARQSPVFLFIVYLA